MENLFRCIQCYACMRPNRLKNHVHARRNQSTTTELRTNSEVSQTIRSTRSRTIVWFAVGWPWKRYVRLGIKLTWSELYLRRRCSFQLSQITWYRPNLQSTSSCGRRIWVFRKETVSDNLQCSKLLRRVWQFGCSDERGWLTYVFISDPKIFKAQEMILKPTSCYYLLY